MADNNMVVAILGKYLPQALIFSSIIFFYEFYIYGILHFPHEGDMWDMLLLMVLQVFSSIGFGIFIFGLMPSLRMSMSICSLWGVLSFTTSGFTFPVFAMDGPIQALSYLFPLRHYYMVYQMCIFNGYPLQEAWLYFAFLALFIMLPLLVMRNLRRAMIEYVYIP